MRIPLTDPIWTRLYGPYGLDDVVGILEELTQHWDDGLAEDLYWERLHHQDDLYPVTYAAIPWLWEIAPQPPNGSANALMFLSHVLYCATCPGGTGCDGRGPRGKYRGLSLLAQDHRFSWIPDDGFLRLKDMENLTLLENWFSGAAAEIAERCVRSIPENDRFGAAMLSKGFAALKGGYETAVAMEMWADDHDMKSILAHCPPTKQDRIAAQECCSVIEGHNKELAAFLTAYATAP